MARIPAVILAALLLSAGCAERVNPSFSVTRQEASHQIAVMSGSPKHAARPVLVLAGYGDIGIASAMLAHQIKNVCDEQSEIVPISFVFCTDFESCQQRVIERVEAKFPSRNKSETVEVDVVGISLGGLIARYAADPPDGHTGKRLKIVNLYTIASPLAGSRAGDLTGWTPLQKAARTDSELIHRLNQHPPHYTLVCYTRLNDPIVGEALAAPAGQAVLWVDTPPLGIAHAGASKDPRIVADISRRIRNEPPLAVQPFSPLPASDSSRKVLK